MKLISSIEEPQYDVDRLATNHLYRFEMVDKFTAYMKNIKPYANRVKYYMKICKVLGLEVPSLNMGSHGIFMKPDGKYDEQTNSFIDEQGEIVPIKHWGITYSNDEEKGILTKLWFMSQKSEQFKIFGHWYNELFEQRKARYFDDIGNWNPIDYTHLKLKVIEESIAQFQQDYTDFKAKQTGYSSFESEAIKNQRLRAPILVESELLENEGINWSIFHEKYQLQPFAFLWDMTEYKLFLIQQTNLLPSPKPETRPFPELLATGYSEAQLIRLLTHLRMRNKKGENVWPQKSKSAIFGVIKALKCKGYLVETTQMESLSSLSTYLGLKGTRVKEGYSKIQTDIERQAIFFLNQEVN